MEGFSFFKYLIVGFFALGIGFWGGKVFEGRTDGTNGKTTLSSEVSAKSYEMSQAEKDLIESMNSEIFEMKSHYDVAKVILSFDEIAKRPESKDFLVVQTYAASTRPLIHLRGIVWRMRQIMERDCKVCHLIAVTRIRDAFYSDYMLGPHLRYLTEYLVHPIDEEYTPGIARGTGNPSFPIDLRYKDSFYFDKVSWLQNYVASAPKDSLKLPGDQVGYGFLSSLQNSRDQLAMVRKVLIDKGQMGTFFEFDMHLLVGKKDGMAFISEMNARKTVVGGNIAFMISNVDQLLGSLKWLGVYNFNRLPHFINDLMLKTSLNQTSGLTKVKIPKANSPIEFMSILKRGFSSVLSLGAHKKLGKMRSRYLDNPKSAENILAQAKAHIKDSIVMAKNGLEESVKGSTGDSNKYLLEPRYLTLEYDSTIQTFEKRIEMYSTDGFVSINTGIDGVVDVNIHALYRPHKSLQNFLPSMANKRHKRTENVPIPQLNVSSDQKINYEYGKPTAADYEDRTFGGLLEESQVGERNFFNTIRKLKISPETKGFAVFLPVP